MLEPVRGEQEGLCPASECGVRKMPFPLLLLECSVGPWGSPQLPLILISVLLPAGGENIKSINQQSGAHVELQRNPPPNTDPSLRVFTIRGVPQQIEVARHLIDEKVGVRTRPFPHPAY